MSRQYLDEAKAEAFAGRMLNALNDAALVQMTSIGHQLGLFDVLADLPPATDQQIAEATGLTVRYVQEWLGAMVTGRVLDYDPESAAYSLPPEHAAVLTRRAGPDNMAGPAQFIPLMAQVEQPVIECFREGGGLPYSAYPRFHLLMSEDSAAIHDATLIDAILPLVPGLIGRLHNGIDVSDIGCGHGHAVNLMAQAFPRSRFVGYDISEEGLCQGRRESRQLGLTNVHFRQIDASQLDIREGVDLITAFDAIHDQAEPDRVLKNIVEALRPGGTFLMADFGASSHVHENLDFPVGPFMYTISCMHCVPVSMGAGGPGLGAMWGEQTARRMLAEAGFAHTEVKQIESDIFNNYFVASKD